MALCVCVLCGDGWLRVGCDVCEFVLLFLGLFVHAWTEGKWDCGELAGCAVLFCLFLREACLTQQRMLKYMYITSPILMCVRVRICTHIPGEAGSEGCRGFPRGLREHGERCYGRASEDALLFPSFEQTMLWSACLASACMTQVFLHLHHPRPARRNNNQNHEP